MSSGLQKSHWIVVASLSLFGLGFFVTSLIFAGDLDKQERRVQLKRDRLALFYADIPPVTPGARDALLARMEAFDTELKSARRRAFANDRFVGSSEVPSAEDLYFRMVNFINETRERARALGISVPDEAAFGFGRFLEEQRVNVSGYGIVARESFLRRLEGELALVEYLIEGLFETKPERLVDLRREAIIPLVESQVGRVSGIYDLSDSATQCDPRYFSSHGLRFVFIGRTESLRRFLNFVAGSEAPLSIANVEVEALATETTARTIPTSGAGTASTPFGLFEDWSGAPKPAEEAEALPIVAENRSRFVVDIEYIRPKGETAPFRLAETVLPIEGGGRQ